MREPKTTPEETGNRAGSQGDEAALRARLEALKIDLGDTVAREKIEGNKAGASRESASAMATGMRAASELFAGVVVGAGIGYVLDAQFGTKPLLLIIFLMCGMAAGFWNVYRLGVRKRVPGGVEGPNS